MIPDDFVQRQWYKPARFEAPRYAPRLDEPPRYDATRDYWRMVFEYRQRRFALEQQREGARRGR